jgi:hypothetical protein
VPPRDLSDFILRWPSFKPSAQATMSGLAIDGRERLVLQWLIELADRVGPADIPAGKAGSVRVK